MPRTVSLGLLNSIQVASPCTADWNEMTGDDRARFCGECSKHVYNISAMTAEDASALIERHEGNLCVRLFKRADGTVLTADCPVGLCLIRQRTARAVGRAAAAAALLVTGALTLATGSRDERLPRLRNLRPFATICEWLSPTPNPLIMGKMVMGAVACPPPTVLPSPQQPGTKP